MPCFSINIQQFEDPQKIEFLSCKEWILMVTAATFVLLVWKSKYSAKKNIIICIIFATQKLISLSIFSIIILFSIKGFFSKHAVKIINKY
jgi:hypothetical protein